MNCPSKQQVGAGGFTLVEIAAALAILAGLLAGALAVMNQAVGAVLEIRGSRQAFETARENLETLLTEEAVSDRTDFGYSERYPEIRWELRVEPFYEPISNQMWIRAVSIAYYRDRNDQEQAVELEQWLTGLSADQIKQILAQQALEEKILEELYGEEDKALEEMTRVCLEQSGLDAAAYKNLLQRQRKEKVTYLLEKGPGKEYEEWLETLENEKAEFLQNLGVDFDRLNECIAFLHANPQQLADQGQELSGARPDTGADSLDMPPDSTPESEPSEVPSSPSEEPDCPFDCRSIDPSLRPIICQLTGCCCD